ncbi:transposase [Lactiplantibacillus nangangensis]|uniref:Transposase n=1 Tax=Lactiplantibacillus nangangensis TaxID=2559917 RepID=A0ABW1SNH4_9LACO|nr:transposase [Lactiplantibacillus nangangensis]
MLPPKEMHEAWKLHHERVYNMAHDYPWLIPALTLLHTVPLAIAIHGFYKTHRKYLELKIEREKTKRQALDQVDKVEDVVKAAHPHCPFHHGCK